MATRLLLLCNGNIFFVLRKYYFSFHSLKNSCFFFFALNFIKITTRNDTNRQRFSVFYDILKIV